MKKVLFAIGLAASLFACQQATPPTITAFDATPASVTSGANVKLSWSVTGADSLEIDQGVGVVTGSTGKDVTVISSKAFTLTAKNANGSVTKSINVTVTGVPASGGKIKLENWPAGQTGTIGIGGGVAPRPQVNFPVTNVAADGSLEYALSTPTSDQLDILSCGGQPFVSSNTAARFGGIGSGFTLTGGFVGAATNPTGLIYVSNVTPPSGTSTPLGTKIGLIVYSSEATKLTGSCNGFTYDADLERGWNYFILTITSGNVPITGTVAATVSLPADMKWYYAQGGNGVIVPPPPSPVINSFDATPASVTSGVTVKLTWNVNGADSLEIDQGVGVVTGSSSKDVTVTANTTFKLTAKNANGSVTKAVNVTVTTIPASGGKLKIENWPAGQTGQIGGGLSSSSMIPLPITSVAADGSLEYALGASTSGQAGNISCGNQTVTSSNPAARILGIGVAYALTRATVGSGSSNTGAIYVANRLFTQSGPNATGDKAAALLYASESTKLTGVCGPITYNADLTAGWNYGVVTFTVSGSTQTGAVSASATLPNDMKWYYVPGNPSPPAR